MENSVYADYVYCCHGTILSASVHELLAMGYISRLEKEMATHSSSLAWKIPGMEEPDRLPSMVSHSVGHG